LDISGGQAVDFVTGAVNDNDFQEVKLVADIERDSVQGFLAGKRLFLLINAQFREKRLEIQAALTGAIRFLTRTGWRSATARMSDLLRARQFS